MAEEDRSIVGLGGKIIDTFRASPTLLALVVLNLFMAGGIFWSVREERVLRADVNKTEQDLISEMAKLLANCDPKR